MGAFSLIVVINLLNRFMISRKANWRSVNYLTAAIFHRPYRANFLRVPKEKLAQRHRNLKLLTTSGASGVGLSAAWFSDVKSEETKMADASTPEGALKQADEYHQANEFQKVYDTLLLHKSEISNCEVQWKLARAARDLAQLKATSKERKKELTYEGLECAENAVKADEKSFAAHKWKGILLSEVGDYEGNKKKIENAYVIRDEFLRASELNPEDATSYFLLGEWCYNVSDMSWMLRQAAKAIFGTPPSSTFDEALKNYLKAEQVSPGFYVGNYVSLGKTYLKLKNKEEAKKWLQKGAEFERESEKDDVLIEEAKALLKTI